MYAKWMLFSVLVVCCTQNLLHSVVPFALGEYCALYIGIYNTLQESIVYKAFTDKHT